MTAVIDDTDAAQDSETAPVVEEMVTDTPAPWWARAGAFGVDVLPGLAVAATMALVCSTVPLDSTWWWVGVSVAAVVMLLAGANRLLLPAVSGWSLGRALCGIAVVRRDGAAVGPGRLLLRDLAHLLDSAAVFIGWLWPLWDCRRRTFADLLLHTEVRRVEPPPSPRDPRRLAAVVALTASLVCAGGAAVSYFVVYQRDRAIDQARAQIASQGPETIEQLLSYDPKSLQDDFAHARSLATDRYREQLVPQQQAVQKAKPVTNEYWVTNSSVLSATPDRATMLLFMQGQRGEPGKERFISATVRVTFAKSVAADWRVDDLTVVTKPLPAEDGN